ncbi:telomerase inhibitor, partial [Ascosphaera acerosa]
MSRQGWAPGETLGARDAAHSGHFTAASHSHIRVARKEDNLGLGARARRPLEDDEPTGLDAFQAMLGRLNGKSDAELLKEQRKVEDRKLWG